MTTVYKIPSYFYGSSDFINPGRINKDIHRIAGDYIYSSSLQNEVQQTLKTASSVLENTYSYMNAIKNDPASAPGFNNTEATKINNNVNSSLNGITGGPSSTSVYQAATAVYNSVNKALESVLTFGQTNTGYNPADSILQTTNNAIDKILNFTFPQSNNDATNIFQDTNTSLDNILSYTPENTNKQKDAVNIFDMTNQSLDEILNSTRFTY